MILRGRLNAFLYRTQQAGFLGFSLAGWLKNVPLLLLLLAWLLEWPTAVLVGLLLPAVLIRLLYVSAERSGFVTFVPDGQVLPAANVERPPDYRKIKVHATGIFAVHEREVYLLQRPADYWRMPLGEHAVMVEERPGRFLYQFFRSDTVQRVRPGHVLFGSQPQLALAIDFISDWGPAGATPGKAYYVGGDAELAGVKRTLYLAFAGEEERQAVWRNLVHDVITDGINE
jgi:hypothetical protein